MSELQLVIKTENETTESKLFFEMGESLLLLCQKAGIPIAANCGGKGICGKCRVRFLKGAPLPTASERRFFSPDELRSGCRLACLTRLYVDCEIEVPKPGGVDAVTDALDITWERMTDYDGKSFITTDIGTTTVVMQKRAAVDGHVVNTYKAVNAQNRFGSDVLSRLEASEHGYREELGDIIRDQLCQGVERLGREDVLFMVIAANTTMVHLLMKYDVSGLGKAPFLAVTLDEIRTDIGGLKTYIMPGYSAFVGGDIYSGMLALNAEKQKVKSKPVLLVDLGTNAEMVLYDDDKMVATSAAAGSAFDSIADAGLFGADVVAILCRLLQEHKIDCHGILQDEWFEHGVLVCVDEDARKPCEADKSKSAADGKAGKTDHRRTVNITQQQIRSMQLAKAAVRCGIDYLSASFGCELGEIGHVYVAGGFGYYLDVEAAFKIGLLPEVFRGKTSACGNTALSGAAVYGYARLSGKKQAEELIKAVAYQTDGLHKTIINLAMEPDFSERYISYLDFQMEEKL